MELKLFNEDRNWNWKWISKIEIDTTTGYTRHGNPVIKVYRNVKMECISDSELRILIKNKGEQQRTKRVITHFLHVEVTPDEILEFGAVLYVIPETTLNCICIIVD